MEAVIGEYCVIPGKVPSQHGGVDEEPYWRRWDYTLFCHFLLLFSFPPTR